MTVCVSKHSVAKISTEKLSTQLLLADGSIEPHHFC